MSLDPDLVFRLGNASALTGWLALMVSPEGRPWTALARRYAGAGLPVAFAVAYVAMLTGGPWPDSGGFGSPAAVLELFKAPHALVAGWLHYLAFDLLVGCWISRDAGRRGLAHGWLLALLPATFLFGPVGWLAYIALRGLVPAGRHPVTFST